MTTTDNPKKYPYTLEETQAQMDALSDNPKALREEDAVVGTIPSGVDVQYQWKYKPTKIESAARAHRENRLADCTEDGAYPLFVLQAHVEDAFIQGAKSRDHDLRLKNLEILSLQDQLSAAMSQLGERAERIRELEAQQEKWPELFKEAERRGAFAGFHAGRERRKPDNIGYVSPVYPEFSDFWAEWDRRRGEG